jgi:hypothetical protein
MTDTLIEQIEAFLEGRITRADLEQEAESMGIKDLEAEIQWVKDTQLAVEVDGLRDQLTHLLKEDSQPATRSRMRVLRPLLAVAASVAVLILGYWAWNQQSDGDLYAQYEYIDPGLPVLMSQSDQHQLYDALTYYGEGQYSVAAEKLESLQSQGMKSDTLSYFLGASRLYAGAAEAAAEPLEQVTAMEGSSYQEKAEWLLVLQALQRKDLASANRRASDIASSDGHAFQVQAEQLLKDLEE